MNELSLLPILVSGLFIAVFHSMIPTHWLPFVMAARTQRWPWSKTLSILLIAGFGHVIMTTLIGALLFSLGLGMYHSIQAYFLPVACLSIASYGAFQIYKHYKGEPHTHCDHDHAHHHNHAEDLRLQSKDGWAVLSLLSLLTFSPCESFLPIYLSAAGFGWQGFAYLSAVLAVGTLSTMVAFTWVSAKTIDRYNVEWLEDYERLVIGIGLILLAIALYIIERSHII